MNATPITRRCATTALQTAAWALAAIALQAPSLRAQETATGLAGAWQLSLRASEDPEKKFTVGAPGSDPREPDPRGMGGQYPSGRDGQRPMRPSPSPSPGEVLAKLESVVPRAFHEFLDAPKELTIAIAGNDVTLEGEGGYLRKLTADGVERRDGPLARSVRWEGEALIVESSSATGERLTTRLSLQAGARVLEVYSRLGDTKGRALTLRRVYYPPGEEPPPHDKKKADKKEKKKDS